MANRPTPHSPFRRGARALVLGLFMGSLVATGGCSSMSEEDGERIGTVLGATAGIFAASRASQGSDPATHAAVTALGAYLGAWVGGKLGKEMTRLDRVYAERALEEGLDHAKDGDAVVWSNPDSGRSGSATPTATSSGGDCRDFETTVLIDGKEEKTSGRACKQPDGTWKVVPADGSAS